MGTTHKSSRASGRIYQPTFGETKRGLETTDRREILRIGHNRIHLRGPERILLSPDQRSESYETWHSPTSQRMDSIERCNAETVCEISDSSIDHPMYLRTESPEPRGLLGMSTLSIRRTVLFNDNITVFTPTDWSDDVYRDARRGNWMRDRIRFKNRIKITELSLGNIFSIEHRERVSCR